MGTLTELLDKGTRNKCGKWRHYFEIYETHFQKFVGKKCTYLEIGVAGGGSLELMRDYLGPDARVIGADIDPMCEKMRAEGFEIHIGNQGDAGFLSEIAQKSGPFDLIVDDGGHTADQQITTFYALFPYLNYGGIYLVEDMHASFWMGYQDSRYGINFYDLAKGMIEKLSGWFRDPRLLERYQQPYNQRQGSIQIQNFAVNDIFGIHFYDSVIVIEKRRISEPLLEIK